MDIVLDRICIALTSYSLYYHPSYPNMGIIVTAVSILLNAAILFFAAKGIAGYPIKKV